MSPKIERPAPPYMQVADHYRRQIQDGTLTDGARLPAVATIAREWGVAHATAAKVISQLQVEGLVISTPRGSFVAARDHSATSAHDRVMRSHRSGSTASQAEHHRILSAALTEAPVYVAELLDLEHGAQVVRREMATIESGRVQALTVTWHAGDLAELVPMLLSTANSQVGQLLPAIEAVAGPVTRGQDWYHARAADSREASALGIPVGSPTLAGTWILWSAADRILEYGETCLPPRSTVSYPYEIPATAPDGGSDD
ncbi:GntR family transcriptional regulator [Kitasatospora sp. NPDC018058]|uniref:GntR family transcriptional regulator n=1 Tax=Kitasatospora sp. NPDC018058 TaxID=3364025 RepID=UPI0037BEAEBF